MVPHCLENKVYIPQHGILGHRIWPHTHRTSLSKRWLQSHWNYVFFPKYIIISQLLPQLEMLASSCLHT